MEARFLLPFLEEQNLLTPDQSREIADEQSRTGKPVEVIVANFGILALPQLLEKISDRLGLALMGDLGELSLSPELLARIPPHTARSLGALPVATDGGSLTVALIDPLASQAIEDLRFATGLEIEQVVAPPDQVQALVERHYGSVEANFEDLISENWKKHRRAVPAAKGST